MSAFAVYYAREVARLWREWEPKHCIELYESGAAFVAFARENYERERGAEKKQAVQTSLFGDTNE